MSLNFMAAVTVGSDFGAQENKICHCLRCFSSICHEVVGLIAMRNINNLRFADDTTFMAESEEE